MIRRIAVVLAFIALFTGAAFAQQSGGGDSKRRTLAITYPPKGKLRVQLAGTTRTPRANAGAEVLRMRGLTQVEIELDDMVPAYLLGADYTTYVLWAVTPEGQVENMGEFLLTGSRSKLRATTRYETFAMFITAEPHYAVSKPSRVVILENVPPKGPAALQSADVYFTGDSGRYFSDSQLPEAATKEYAKQPIQLLGARRAIQIAKLAGADQFARRDIGLAEESFAKAETFYLNGDRPSSELLGRKSIREAERAREISEERAEAKRVRDEMRAREEAIAVNEKTMSEYLDKIDDLEAQLKVSEGGRTRAEEGYERANDEAADLRAQLRVMQAQLDDVQNQLRQAQDRVGSAERERDAERVAVERTRSFQALQQMLGSVAKVQADARGFKVILPDSMFDARTGALKATAAAKLNPIAGVLLGHPAVPFLVEGYMDDRGNADVLLQNSTNRAQSVSTFLINAGVAQDRFSMTGYGSASPIASNKSVAGRGTNRRVELVFLRQ